MRDVTRTLRGRTAASWPQEASGAEYDSPKCGFVKAMTSAQIAEAQWLAREWVAKK
jgi:hypothetical protein